MSHEHIGTREEAIARLDASRQEAARLLDAIVEWKRREAEWESKIRNLRTLLDGSTAALQVAIDHRNEYAKRARESAAELDRAKQMVSDASGRSAYDVIDAWRGRSDRFEFALPSDDVIELIRVAIDPDEPRLSGSCRAMVDVWLNRVSAARKVGE